jgi:putative toxin-antitoxin system antitoxin component (TIGR02293 family)
VPNGKSQWTIGNDTDRLVKAYASTLAVLGLYAREKQSRHKRHAQASALPAGPAGLIEVRDGVVPFAALTTVATLLGVQAADLLKVIGMTQRTAARRKTDGFLTADEADRLLRVVRVIEEATRVFGSQEKAALWLRTAAPILGNVEPFRLLESDAGAKAVSDELIRIDFGDFA